MNVKFLPIGLFILLLPLPACITTKPSLINVHPPSPIPTCRYVIEDRRLNLVVFDFEGDHDSIVARWIINELNKGNRFNILNSKMFYEETLSRDFGTIDKLGMFKLRSGKYIYSWLLPESASLLEISSKWRADLALYGKVLFDDVVMGIDIKLMRLPTCAIVLSDTIFGPRHYVEKEIAKFIKKIHETFPVKEGRVVLVSPDSITIDLGERDGVTVGTRLIVYRVFGLKKDKIGNIIGIDSRDIGLIKIVKTEEHSSTCVVLSSSPCFSISINDMVVTK